MSYSDVEEIAGTILHRPNKGTRIDRSERFEHV